MLMLLATLGVVITVWLPTLQQVLFHKQLPGAKRGLARVMLRRGFAVAKPEPKGHPRFSGGALNPDNYRSPTGLPRLFEQLMGAPRSSPHQRSMVGRTALAREGLVLRDRADDGGDGVMLIRPGGRLTIVKDLGTWMLLSQRKGDKIIYGWARSSSFTILP